MRKALMLTLVCLMTALLPAPGLRADVPEQMAVQGRLTDAAGDPASAGFKSFTFKIFDQEVGGTEIWPAGSGENQTLVTDADGLWNADLGAVVPLPAAVFDDSSRWLQVTVDDGVNPAETLPRIKLNTGPFAYRAASAQDADALGGLTVPDLDNAYVNVDGDTMTGDLLFDDGIGALDLDVSLSQLRGYRDDGSLNLRLGSSGNFTRLSMWGSNVERVQLTAGNAYGYLGLGDDNGTFTAELHASSTGGGFMELAQEDGTQGVLLRGGNTSNGAVLNMYSAGGANTITLNADLTGNGAAVLPSASIYDVEILDEPGLSQAILGSGPVLSSVVYTTILSHTISCPTSGYVLVMANADASITHTTSGVSASGVGFGVHDAANAVDADQDLDVQVSSTAPNGTYWAHLATQKAFSVSAGTRTFYVNGQKSLSGGGDARAYSITLTLLFVPTSYGLVANVIASSRAGDFESTRPVDFRGSPDSSELASGALVEVDLRELEVRAARAEAEAERTKRELREAELAEERAPQVSGGMTPSEAGSYE